MNFSPEQLIKLSWLIYYMRPEYITESSSLGDIINKLINGLNSGDNYKELLVSRKNSKKFLLSIVNDSAISSLILDKYKEDITGQRIAVCSYNNDAIIIFRGTASKREWIDNADSVIMKDTPLQKSCKEFVDEIINTNNYNSIITLGHSKGGNLAQYVAIKCDKINKAISINGTGFSNKFCAEYAKLICKNKNKIYEINSKKDIVSQILNHFSDNIKVIDTNVSYFKAHLPMTLLKNGKLNSKAVVSKALKNWNKFTINISKKTPKIAFILANSLTALIIILQNIIINMYDMFNK